MELHPSCRQQVLALINTMEEFPTCGHNVWKYTHHLCLGWLPPQTTARGTSPPNGPGGFIVFECSKPTFKSAVGVMETFACSKLGVYWLLRLKSSVSALVSFLIAKTLGKDSVRQPLTALSLASEWQAACHVSR